MASSSAIFPAPSPLPAAPQRAGLSFFRAYSCAWRRFCFRRSGRSAGPRKLVAIGCALFNSSWFHFRVHNSVQENGEEEQAAVADVINVQQAVLEMLAANKLAQQSPTPLNVSAGGGAAARSRADAQSIKEIVLEMLSVKGSSRAPEPSGAAAAGTTVKNSDGSLTAQV